MDLKTVFMQALQHHKNGELDNAIKIYEIIIKQLPNHKNTISHLAVAYAEKKQFDTAIKFFRQAISIEYKSASDWLNLAKAYQENKQDKPAISSYQQTIKLDPLCQEAYLNLSKLYLKWLMCEESEGLLLNALSKFPDNIDFKVQLAMTYQRVNKTDEGIKIFEEVLKVKKDDLKLHLRYSALLFDKLDIPNAWQYYEGRWALKVLHPTLENMKDLTLWNGEDLNDKYILIQSEQAYGDTINFIRYLPMLKERFPKAKLLFRAHEPLTKLLSENFPQAKHYKGRMVFNHRVDFWYSLMSLPYYFQSDIDSIPCKDKYIQKVSGNNILTKDNKQNKFYIGICWQGRKDHSNDFCRSIDLKNFIPLTEIDNTCLVSLQYGEAEQQLDQFDEFKSVIKTTNQINNFCDTSQLIEELDLVISIDTAIIHLSAAMGKETWLLLPTNPDWRWGNKGDSSYWYNSIKIYRQKKAFHWEDLLQNIKKDIQTKLNIC